MFALEATSCKGPGFRDCCPQVSASSPEVFGPPMWFSLHTMAAKYPQVPDASKRASCVQMLKVLPDLLPCEECSNHFRAFVETIDLEDVCSSRDKFSSLMCCAHNDVNSRTGKDIFPCDAVIERYSTSALCPAPGGEEVSGVAHPDVEVLIQALRNTVSLGLQREGVIQGVCGAESCNAS